MHFDNISSPRAYAGRVVGIAIDPRVAGSNETIYIATSDGGIWKSTDSGQTWSVKTDFMPSLVTGEFGTASHQGGLALDPGNPSIVYAAAIGQGVYKSTDGGDTWAIPPGQPPAFKGIITDILLTAPGKILVSVKDAGLYRSEDGGSTWGGNAPSFNDGQPLPLPAGLIDDIQLDTASSNTVYVTVAGQGLLRSTDGGRSFATLFVPPSGSFAELSLAQSTLPNNQTMYLSSSNYVSYEALWKSTDGGATWANLGNPTTGPGRGCQCSYDIVTSVDPQDPNRVYLGLVHVLRSTDGGATFNIVPTNLPHDDQHIFVYSPATHYAPTLGSTTRLYVGNDGGIAVTSDGGDNFTNLNNGLNTALFYSTDIGRGSGANNAYSYGGTQDNGTPAHQPGFPGFNWLSTAGGDGGFHTLADPTNPLRAYATEGSGGLPQGDNDTFATSDGGSTWSQLPESGRPSGGIDHPLAIDPNTGELYMYISSSPPQAFGVFSSMDGGQTVGPVHNFPNDITYGTTTRLDSNTMWLGFVDGTLAHTANLLSGASSTWTVSSVTGAPPGQPVTGLAIDPTNTSTVVVTYGGSSGMSPPINRTKHVFMTTDGGATWNDISGTDGGDPTQNFPDISANSVTIDAGTSPHSIIVGTDAGVLRSENGGSTWQVLGVGMPAVKVTTVSLDDSVTPPLLRAGTFGRSMFELTAATGPLLAVNADLAFGNVAVGSTGTRITQLFNVGSSDLHVNGITETAGTSAFKIVSGPTTPVTVHPGNEVDFTFQFAPTSSGNQSATFQINSDDPTQPSRPLPASGTGVTPKAAVASSSVPFPNLAVDNRTVPDFSDQIVRILNQASCDGCDLKVTSLPITGSAAIDFTLASPPPLPATVPPGAELDVSVRFNPSSAGGRVATLTVNSNDPLHPSIPVTIGGVGLLPSITPSPATLVFGPTVYDPNCASSCGSVANQTVANNGLAELLLDQISFTGAAYSGPGPTSPVTRVAVAQSFVEPVTFHPSGGPSRKVTGVLHVQDSLPFDPGNVVATDIPLCGESVGRGVRVLAVDHNGVPVAKVSDLHLTTSGISPPTNVDGKNLALTTIDPPTSCQRIQFQYENQNLPATSQASTHGSSYTLTVQVGAARTTVGFTLGVNEFKVVVVTVG